jgi:flagellar biogenesis protein FliO
MKKHIFALALLESMAPALAWAQSAADSAEAKALASAPALSQWPGFKDLAWAGVALVVVLVTLVLLLKAVQRVGRLKAGRGSLFEIRGYQPLDNRKYLAAVAVDGRMLIIGVTPERLIPLGQWPLEDQGLQGLFPPDGLDLGLKPQASEDAPPDISVVGPGGDPRP